MKDTTPKILTYLLTFIFAIMFSSNTIVLAADDTTIPGIRENSTDYVYYDNDHEVIIEDSGLNEALHLKLNIPAETKLTKAALARVNYLTAQNFGIKSLKGLEYCINLTSLNLSGNPEIKDFSPIKNLSNLVTLNLSNNPNFLNATCLNGLNNDKGEPIISSFSFDKLTNLRVLDIHSTGITSLDVLSPLENLVSLNCNNNNVIENLTTLSQFKNLTNLYLSNNNISDLSPLSYLNNLVTLHVANNRISDASPISGITTLVDLDMNNNSLDTIEDLLFLYNLEHLCLENNEISDISSIPVLRKLETLALSDNKISDITSIIQLLKLNYVTLSNQKIEITPENNNIVMKDGKLTINNPIFITNEEQLHKDKGQLVISNNGTETLDSSDNKYKISWDINADTNNKYLTCSFNKDDIDFHDAKTSFNGIFYVPCNVTNDHSEDISVEKSTYKNTTHDSYVHFDDMNLKLGVLKALGITKNAEGNDLSLDDCKKIDITPYQMSTINYLVIPGRDNGDPVSIEKDIDKKVDINVPENASDETIIEAFKKTDKYKNKYKIKNLNGLQYCINLTTLNLYGNAISDLTCLSGLRSLTNLNLGNNKITNIKPLSFLRNLSTLSIFTNEVKDISPIKNLTSLSSLYLHCNPVDRLCDNNDSSKSYFKNLNNLNILFLGHPDSSKPENKNNIPNYNLNCLSNLTQLKTLYLGNAGINSIGNSLDNLKNLTYLDLKNNNLKDISDLLNSVKTTSKDTSTETNTNQNNTEKKDISGLENTLTYLCLENNKIDSLSNINKLKNLKYLYIRNNCITDLSPLNDEALLTSLNFLDMYTQNIDINVKKSDIKEGKFTVTLDLKSINNSIITNVIIPNDFPDERKNYSITTEEIQKENETTHEITKHLAITLQTNTANNDFSKDLICYFSTRIPYIDINKDNKNKDLRVVFRGIIKIHFINE